MLRRLLSSVATGVEWLIIAIACLSAVGAFEMILASHARAAELNQEQARGIYYVAYGQVHGPREYLEQMPPVRVVSPAALCAMAEEPADCPVRGLYKAGVVHVSSALDFSTVEDASILLHEFVHHLQELKRGRVLDYPPDQQCAEALDREHEAYRIQAEVLYKSGAGLAARGALQRARSLRC